MFTQFLIFSWLSCAHWRFGVNVERQYIRCKNYCEPSTLTFAINWSENRKKKLLFMPYKTTTTMWCLVFCHVLTVEMWDVDFIAFYESILFPLPKIRTRHRRQRITSIAELLFFPLLRSSSHRNLQNSAIASCAYWLLFMLNAEGICTSSCHKLLFITCTVFLTI